MRLEPVIWSKGTFLSPQHLQSQDKFLEDLLRFHIEALQFRPWGFRRVRIDQAGLAAGTLALSEAAGILPDGLPFDMPQSDALPPAKPLAEHFSAGAESLDVYLSLPAYREGGFNIAGPQRGAETRYRAEVELLKDENTGTAEKPVMLARKNFRLLVETENREGRAVLRVARVRKSQTGLFELDPRFAPPLVSFHGSDYLVSIARSLVEILSAKSAELARSRRQKNQSLADFTAADIPRFWLLYTANRALPELRHLFETRQCHPEPLYAAMLSLAGALTTFSTQVQPRDLPIYDHDDPGSCFSALDGILKLLLETVLPNNCVSLALTPVRPAIYAASIDDERYLDGTRMYLAVSADASQSDIMTKAPQLIKVSSAEAVEHLVQRALPGVALSRVSAPPSAIPVKLNYQYFKLNQSGGPWEAVVRSRNLAAYVPGDFANVQLELIIVLPSTA